MTAYKIICVLLAIVVNAVITRIADLAVQPEIDWRKTTRSKKIIYSLIYQTGGIIIASAFWFC